MPKGKNQKMKLYRLYRIMLKETDEEHGLSVKQIQDRLAEWDVTVDRKTLYEDFAALEEMGLEIEMNHTGNTWNYRITGKLFELPELKLLVDAVQSSKFITEKKSRSLIQKLTALASNYEAGQLKRSVIVAGRIKAMNESIYYNVDMIDRAIAENKMISFVYMQWNLEKKLVPRKEELYHASPWALTWDSENYYLIAWDEKAGKIKNYRVDKMKSINVETASRKGRSEFAKINMALYTRRQFGMFHGEEEPVTIRFDNELAGVMIDRFGRDILIRKVNDSQAEITVLVHVSSMFFGWITGLGNGVRITGPDEVVQQYQDQLVTILSHYS